MMKFDNKAKAELLQPLETPSRKWAHVTTGLIISLPESNGFMAIVVFVDISTKMMHIAGCKKEVIAIDYALIFLAMSFCYTVSQRSLYLTGIHILLASSGVYCLTSSI